MVSSRYLLHFVMLNEHISFKWAEFTSLASLYNFQFKLISPAHYLERRPCIVIEIDDQEKDKLITSVQKSYLLKGLYELWAHSTSSIDHLVKEVYQSPHFLSGLYSGPDQSFRVNCASHGVKLNQAYITNTIEKLSFMETFQSAPNLTQPKQIYCVFEQDIDDKSKQKEYYFCRLVTNSDRAKVFSFNLKERKFIANTSMDPMLSLIAANCAKVKQNDVVYDPFVGSGGLLVAAAYKGAYVMGSDIDWKLLHGKSKPSRTGQTVRSPGESVRANLEQYNLGSLYIDVMVSDIARSPLNEKFTLDAIITDPPYGIREASEKVGPREGKKNIKGNGIRYPTKTSYDIRELLEDLLKLSAKHLVIGGRLVYFLPITKSDDDDTCNAKKCPTHPCLKLISHCEQQLNYKAARLMVIMEKVREPTPDDTVYIPEILHGTQFRDNYFNIKSCNR